MYYVNYKKGNEYNEYFQNEYKYKVFQWKNQVLKWKKSFFLTSIVDEANSVPG